MGMVVTPRPTFMNHPLAIIGAGIGGLTLAVALQRRKLPFIIYERAPELREIGAGLLLTSNATAVLNKLGLLDAARSAGHVNEEFRLLNQRGQLLASLDQRHFGTPSLGLTRADLQRILQLALPASSIRFGHALVGLQSSGAGVRLEFSHAPAITAAAVVGADGTHSCVGRLGKLTPAAYSGYVGWRAVVAGVPNGYSGPWLSETWGRGGRFGIAPIGGGRTYWYASANFPEGTVDEPATRQERLLQRFSKWHAPIRDLIGGTRSEDILFTPIYDRAPQFRLNGTARDLSARCILLGDAAHPLTPNLGQGACMAIEDAAALAELLPFDLDDHSARAKSWDGFEAARRKRCQRIYRASNLTGWLVQCERPVFCRLRDAWMAMTPSWVHRRGTDWIFRGR